MDFDGIMETSGGFWGIARQTLARKLFRRVVQLTGNSGGIARQTLAWKLFH